MKYLKSHPALAGMIVTIIGAILGFFIHNPAMVASLLGVAGILFGIDKTVMTVTDAAVKVTDAATTTATEVVKSIDKTVVGTVGEVAPAAKDIINNTVDEVVGALFPKKNELPSEKKG